MYIHIHGDSLIMDEYENTEEIRDGRHFSNVKQ